MHDYRVTTFLSPTYCEQCARLLWGLTRQGVRCVKCNAIAHRQCAEATTLRCVGDRGLAELVPGIGGRVYARRLDAAFWEQVREEAAANEQMSRQAEQPLSLFQTLPANFMQFTAKLAPLSLVHRAATDIVFWRRPRTTLAAMCVYSAYCLRPHLLLATPLALLIAFIVFARINGPARPERGAPRSPPLPARPALGSRRPQVRGLGMGILMPGQSSRTSAVAEASAGTQPRRRRRGLVRERRRSALSPAELSAPSSESSPTPSLSLSPSPPLAAAGSGGGHDGGNIGGAALWTRGSASAPASPTGSGSREADERAAAVDFAALLGVAGFGSARYTENVHTTQTLTGTYVGVYDWVAAHSHLVDWSQPAEARRVLGACAAAQAAVLVAAYAVPVRVLFLCAGNAALLAMSPHARAFAKIYGTELALHAHAWAMARWAAVQQRAARAASSRWVPAGLRRAPEPRGGGGSRFVTPDQESGSDDDDDDGAGDGYRTPPVLVAAGQRTHLVSVFENQRWWLGLGWVPRLGSNERAKWSDEAGVRRFASIRDFMPPDGFEWADAHDGWEIDRHWALPVRTDAEGWVYTDNFWRRRTATPSAVSSYTRRRRWIRRVQPAPA